jgi:flavin reductase (DIM6/NTAB) family NADH-FMN oxidoreductase RutF
MNNFDEKEYKIFKMFHEQWALVTAGKIEKFNTCTVGWGSLGTLWTRPGKNGAIVTAYLHPARYTREVLQQNDIFTVSFFPNEYRKALGYLGTHSGRNEDKVSASGLSPISIDQGVTFKEANLTFVCRKLYQHQLSKENIAKDVQDYYIANPKSYPLNENGEWEPHWLFIGEIVDVKDNR